MQKHARGTSRCNIIGWQYLLAASIFAIDPVVILFMSTEKNLISGLTAGGAKG